MSVSPVKLSILLFSTPCDIISLETSITQRTPLTMFSKLLLPPPSASTINETFFRSGINIIKFTEIKKRFFMVEIA